MSSGDLAAAIGLKSKDEAIGPMIPNALEAGIDAFRSRGHYPINHLVVIRDDVLEAHPGVAVAIFDAFAKSRDLYLDRLRNGEIEDPTAVDQLHARLLEMGAEPLPYGIENNYQVLDELIAHATTQKILTKPVNVESVFAPGVIEE